MLERVGNLSEQKVGKPVSTAMKGLSYPVGGNRFTELDAELLGHLRGPQMRMLNAEAHDGTEWLSGLFLNPGEGIPGARQQFISPALLELALEVRWPLRKNGGLPAVGRSASGPSPQPIVNR